MATLPDGAVRSARFQITGVDTAVIMDSSLTFDARGLYAYLASFDVLPSFDQIVANTADGPDDTRRALDELIERGLVRAEDVQ